MQTENLRLTLSDRFHDRIGLTMQLKSCLHSATSPFQHIAVYDSQDLGKVLCLGGSIVLTELDEAWYAEHLAHPALAAHPKAKRVLIVGGGDGGLARECLRYASVESVTVVEIDRQVVEVAQRYFPTCAIALADPRVKLIYDDAHRWLRDCQERFDIIIVDGAELVNAPSDAFFTLSFAETVFQALDPKGILVLPLGCPAFETELCRGSLQVLAARFAHPQVYLLNLPSLPTGEWAVAWCSAAHSPLTLVAEPQGAASLMSWHAGVQPGLFALPRQVQRQLGLPG
jgi:spermidine synthase